MQYEYIAIPAPVRGKQGKGQKTAVERLASAMTDILNEMAEEQWEFIRTETLTIEDKPHRLAKLVERIETVLVFRRPFDFEDIASPTPEAQRLSAEDVEPPARQEWVDPPVRSEAQPPRAALERNLDDEDDDLPPAPSLGGASRD